MSDKEFALECLKVHHLAFVDQVNIPVNSPYVFVELSPALTAVLPAHLSVLQFERSEFRVKNVLARFEAQIVKRLMSMAELAQAQLASAKRQTRI